MKVTRLALLSCCVAMAMSASAFAATIAGWTFETSVPATAGPHAAEVGTGAALGSHASGSTVYSNPSGNGTTESFSSNFWSVGDYYQFSTSSSGYSGLTLTFDATGSNTGPAAFKVQASTDGVSFSDIGYTYTLTNDAWSASLANPVSTRSTALPASLDNQASIYLRFVQDTATAINGSPVATGGTSRIDNVLIEGTALVPEPSSIALALASLGFVLIRRK